jgi:peptidoglycan/xylan/chitin deacetylase (PgdA/CDA1 family)
MLFPKSIWKISLKNKKMVYLTFDDGPIPEVTPWVLDILDQYQIKATFFCVGDNVRKFPENYKEILKRGHKVGNHTHNHLQGWKTFGRKFVNNVKESSRYIQSNLFRPPHGHMFVYQLAHLHLLGYKTIMWDVVTRDYSKRMTPQQVFNNVKKYTRNGSIIVFHDSLKAEKNLRYALPHSIEWLLKEGYTFGAIE